jgi:hypothetical protein
MDSSCELLSSQGPASGSVHCCLVPCRTLRSISRGVVQRRASLRGVRLTDKTQEAYRCVWVHGEARRAAVMSTCIDVHDFKPCVLSELGQSPAEPPSEQQVHSKVSLRRAVDAV